MPAGPWEFFGEKMVNEERKCEASLEKEELHFICWLIFYTLEFSCTGNQVGGLEGKEQKCIERGGIWAQSKTSLLFLVLLCTDKIPIIIDDRMSLHYYTNETIPKYAPWHYFQGNHLGSLRTSSSSFPVAFGCRNSYNLFFFLFHEPFCHLWTIVFILDPGEKLLTSLWPYLAAGLCLSG